MAQEQKKVTTGGNKPKPPSTGGNKPKPASNGAGSGQSAKDKSRAQSRSVSAKSPSGRAGPSTGQAKKGGNTPRPGARPQTEAAPRRISGTMMAWGAVGLVILIVLVLVVVKVASGSSNPQNASYTPVTPAPANVVHDVSNIPLSVWNKVGISSPTVSVTPPTIVKGQPPLTLDGNSPSMLYYGAEYCPYCAAERWALTTALARFGTWSNLKVTASSHTDVDAETHTFSFHGASLSSPYIHFTGIEQYTNVPTATAGEYTVLQNPTKEQLSVIQQYSSSKYLGANGSSSSGGISFPFVDINNLAIISGASYDPAVLAGQSWSQIAGDLDNPNNPATQAILTTANYMSAAICASSKNAPSSVCDSSGVQAAAKALKLS
jgi:Domain of unknown function (DUF929)